jgi:hypothetical protein
MKTNFITELAFTRNWILKKLSIMLGFRSIKAKNYVFIYQGSTQSKNQIFISRNVHISPERQLTVGQSFTRLIQTRNVPAKICSN